MEAAIILIHPARAGGTAAAAFPNHAIPRGAKVAIRSAVVGAGAIGWFTGTACSSLGTTIVANCGSRIGVAAVVGLRVASTTEYDIRRGYGRAAVAAYGARGRCAAVIGRGVAGCPIPRRERGAEICALSITANSTS